jgi:carbamoyl-phosphate synthase/aspartate carbamoyltransferase/dihydroorotase
VDCVAQDGEVVVMAISEHVENAGVHSGDATMVQPPQDINQQTKNKIRDIACSIAWALAVSGKINVIIYSYEGCLFFRSFQHAVDCQG